MAGDQIARNQVEIFSPVVDKLITMFGAARDAFNRHSRSSLEDLQNLKKALAQDIGTAHNALTGMIPAITEKERGSLLRLQSILNHLEIIGETTGNLSEPLQKKIKDGVLFSDKAVQQTNYLFNQQTGMLRSVLDIIVTGNEFLKQYVLGESHKMIQGCLDFATEHEARLIEGVCLPQAAPIFLAILDGMRIITQHEVDIVKILDQES
jgi:Na+/phosphate symporter